MIGGSKNSTRRWWITIFPFSTFTVVWICWISTRMRSNSCSTGLKKIYSLSTLTLCGMIWRPFALRACVKTWVTFANLDIARRYEVTVLKSFLGCWPIPTVCPWVLKFIREIPLRVTLSMESWTGWKSSSWFLGLSSSLTGVVLSQEPGAHPEKWRRIYRWP